MPRARRRQPGSRGLAACPSTRGAGGARVEREDPARRRRRRPTAWRRAARAAAAPTAAGLDPRVAAAQACIRELFAGPPEGLARIVRQLEELLGAPRDEWPTATARALFDTTFEMEEQRKRSPHHESRWLNLTGFCLRPGTGAPLDDWRAKQMWRIFNEELVHPRAEQCRLAWWIAWRRIAGGLTKGQQHQIYLRLSQLFLPGAKGRKKWDEVKPTAEEAAEMLRCLANMERLSPEAKMPLGDELVRRLESRRAREEGIELWALARLGARMPLYGPLNCVVAASKAAAWLDAVLAWSWPQPQRIALSIAQLARRTGDRSRDLPDEARARASSWLRQAGRRARRHPGRPGGGPGGPRGVHRPGRHPAPRPAPGRRRLGEQPVDKVTVRSGPSERTGRSACWANIAVREAGWRGRRGTERLTQNRRRGRGRGEGPAVDLYAGLIAWLGDLLTSLWHAGAPPLLEPTSRTAAWCPARYSAGAFRRA